MKTEKVNYAIVHHIDWDTDGQDVDLPDEVFIKIPFGEDDFISDMLFFQFGFCVNACEIKFISIDEYYKNIAAQMLIVDNELDMEIQHSDLDGDIPDVVFYNNVDFFSDVNNMSSVKLNESSDVVDIFYNNGFEIILTIY